jgi:PKD repeat protein
LLNLFTYHMKKNIYSLITFLICTVLSVNSFSQNLKPISTASNKVVNHEFCASDFFHEEKMKTDIGYRNRYLQMKDQLQQLQLQKNPVNGIYQVPVVVHVMHKGEAVGAGTNISDADVKLGIQYLNNFWRKAAGSVGDGDGVDMQIEFTLAIQDEGGNCTDGIDRVDMSGVSSYVNNGVKRSTAGIDDYNGDAPVNSLKEYSIWDPTEFYNVWLVDEIDNANCYSGGSYTAGYAYYSSAHGQAYDGSVVLICSYLDDTDVTWAHEMGHAFNLPHTFDGDNDGANCGDDGITDTPAHKRTSSFDPSIYFDCTNTDANNCDLSFNQEINPETGFRRNTGTHQDHMHNYMDYTGCATEFTGGQRTVAIAAMTGARASFLSGYALTPPLPATVDFSSAASVACTGSSVVFTDESTCTPNTYTNTGYTGISFLWTFDNGVGTSFNSTDQNPSITFNTPGTYAVTLEVTNPQGTTSKTKNSYIIVTAGATAASCSPNLGTNFGNFNHTIWNVELNTINNTTSTSSNGDDGYEDFSCSVNTTLQVGNSYDLSIGVKASNFGYDEEFCVWIDWDNSGTFETSNGDGVNEKVFSGNTPENTSNTFTQSITVPASAVQNTLLRMRVYGEANTLTDNEMLCVSGSFFVGDIEDYGLLVEAAGSAPVADFNASSTSVCEGGSITFTDASTESPTSWSWNFGDGGTSTVQNPTHVYAAAGTYTVTLTATNATGSDDEIKNNHITVNANPDLSVTSSTDETCTGNDGTASVSLGVGTYMYSWNTAPIQTTSMATGLVAATYNVTVTNAATTCFASTNVVVNDGCAGSAPVADFSTSSTSVCENGSVTFTDLSTNTPTSWLWNFGDGGTSTVQNPTHVYATAGTYTVTLTATNATGSDGEVKNNHITVNACGTTKLRNIDCGITLSNYTTYITCDYVVGATQYEYEITNGGLGYSQTIIRNSNYRFIYLGTITGILSNTTYDIRVRAKVGGSFGNYGATCQVTTPINNFSTQLMSNHCNYTLSSYSELIKCDYLEGATEYEYEITNGGLGFSETVLKPSTYRSLFLSQVAGISDGVTYDIRVRAKINGVFTNYGASCQVTTPTSFTTKLRDIDCGKTLPDSATYITCDYIPGATQYQYEIVNATPSFIDTITRPSNYRFIYLNSVLGIQYNKIYDIKVRAYVNGSWTNFGTVCQVTTPASAIVSGDAVSRLANNNEVENENIPTTLTIYPNPNQGEYLFVELADLSPNSELVVTDIYGKQIERMILNTEDSNYNTTVKFTNKLTSGFYLVTVHSNGQSTTKKLIVR